MSLIWIDGTLIDKSQARISPLDHGFLYGDGVWEHLRFFGGIVFRPMEHLQLLFLAAETLGIDIPLTPDELAAAIQLTLQANYRVDGYIRVIVTRGPGTLGPDPRKVEPHFIIIAEEYQPFPIELYGHGLHVTSVTLPMNIAYPLFQVRTLGQPHIVQAKRIALQRGCLEAVMSLHKGDEHVFAATEGSLFAVKAGEVVLLRNQLADVTGSAVARLASEAGHVVVQRPILQSELRDADEIVLAGTSCGVIGIVQLDDVEIGSGSEGDITRDLRARYLQTIRKTS